MLHCVSITVDITTYFHGFHGDVNETVFVGKVDEQARKLVKVTYESLAKAIEIGNNTVMLVV